MWGSPWPHGLLRGGEPKQGPLKYGSQGNDSGYTLPTNEVLGRSTEGCWRIHAKGRCFYLPWSWCLADHPRLLTLNTSWAMRILIPQIPLMRLTRFASPTTLFFLEGQGLQGLTTDLENRDWNPTRPLLTKWGCFGPEEYLSQIYTWCHKG